MKTLLLLLFINMGCALGPVSSLESIDFQGFYTDKECKNEPVYVQFTLQPVDMVKKVEGGNTFYLSLGQKIGKGTTVYRLQDEICYLQFFEKVKPFEVYRLGPSI